MADEPRVVWDFSATAAALGVPVEQILKKLSLDQVPQLGDIERLMQAYRETEGSEIQVVVLLKLAGYFVKREHKSDRQKSAP